MRAVIGAVRPHRRAERGRADRAGSAARGHARPRASSSVYLGDAACCLKCATCRSPTATPPALWDVSLDVDAGELVSRRRPQRRRQDDADQRHRRPAARARGRAALRRRRHHARARRTASARQGIALVPEGRRLFTRMTVRGEPRARLLSARRRAGAARRHRSSACTACSRSCATSAAQLGRRAVGRPAADGGDRPRADGAAAPAAARRALARPGADHRRADVRDHPRDSTPRAWPCCWSSRMS